MHYRTAADPRRSLVVFVCAAGASCVREKHQAGRNGSLCVSVSLWFCENRSRQKRQADRDRHCCSLGIFINTEAQRTQRLSGRSQLSRRHESAFGAHKHTKLRGEPEIPRSGLHLFYSFLPQFKNAVRTLGKVAALPKCGGSAQELGGFCARRRRFVRS
jgi:hypothetical protein